IIFLSFRGLIFSIGGGPRFSFRCFPTYIDIWCQLAVMNRTLTFSDNAASCTSSDTELPSEFVESSSLKFCESSRSVRGDASSLSSDLPDASMTCMSSSQSCKESSTETAIIGKRLRSARHSLPSECSDTPSSGEATQPTLRALRRSSRKEPSALSDVTTNTTGRQTDPSSATKSSVEKNDLATVRRSGRILRSSLR
ncbi:hypothetical protein SK128_023136, partial [Halocaridina rubra]